MKIRRDFVTNSSSSSYVIGKYEDKNVNRDFVFNMIKEFYKEYLKNRDDFKKIMGKFNITYTENKNGWGRFEFIGGNKFTKKQEDIEDLIEKTYNVSIYDIYDWNYDWLKCNTYSDYEKFWIETIKKYKGCHAPFAIHDYSGRKDSYSVDGGEWGIREDGKRSNKNIGLLSWYIPCAAKYGEGLLNCKNKELFFEENSYHCDWCYNKKDSSACQRVRQILKERNLTVNNIVSIVLGKVCIHSENGYIPDSIVNKLEDISEYACRHMG